MRRTPLSRLAGLCALLLAVPTFAWAGPIHVPGIAITPLEILGNVIGWGVALAVPFATTLFLGGAFWTVAAAGKEEEVKRGHSIMVKSIIGLVIILLGYAIIEVIFWMLGI